MTETFVEQSLRRASNAAITAICDGATDDEVRAAIEAGIAEGHRVMAVRRGEAPLPPVKPTPKYVPPPGSAIEELFRETGVI